MIVNLRQNQIEEVITVLQKDQASETSDARFDFLNDIITALMKSLQ